jgi:hypothetical protein
VQAGSTRACRPAPRLQKPISRRPCVRAILAKAAPDSPRSSRKGWITRHREEGQSPSAEQLEARWRSGIARFPQVPTRGTLTGRASAALERPCRGSPAGQSKQTTAGELGNHRREIPGTVTSASPTHRRLGRLPRPPNVTPMKRGRSEHAISIPATGRRNVIGCEMERSSKWPVHYRTPSLLMESQFASIHLENNGQYDQIESIG